MQASEQTGGIFDVTCAPLINLWGFGFTKFDSITPQLVDSIRHFVGFRKVHLQGNRVMKDDPRILLNFSVLGGGTICNIIACLFDRKGISNYMIDIGGEMIAKGKNRKGGIGALALSDRRMTVLEQTPSLNKLCNCRNGWDSQLPATTVISI